MRSGIDRRTTSDRVCKLLRLELLSGNIESHAALREEELADRFGVSRHPVRKALQQLTLEGLLVAKPNCGVVVAEYKQDHVRPLLTPMRQTLELYALETAIQHGAECWEASIEDWSRIVNQMWRAGEDGDAGAMLDLDIEFHQRILIAAGLDSMLPVWQGIFSRMREYHKDSNAKLDDFRVIAYIHEQLLKCFIKRDSKSACEDLKSHLDNGSFNTKHKSAWNRKNKVK